MAGYPGAVYRRFDDPERARVYVFGGRAGTADLQTPLRIHVTVSTLDGGGRGENDNNNNNNNNNSNNAKGGGDGDGNTVFTYGVHWGSGDPRNESGRLQGIACASRSGAPASMA